jgi:hypothetical protein
MRHIFGARPAADPDASCRYSCPLVLLQCAVGKQAAKSLSNVNCVPSHGAAFTCLKELTCANLLCPGPGRVPEVQAQGGVLRRPCAGVPLPPGACARFNECMHDFILQKTVTIGLHASVTAASPQQIMQNSISNLLSVLSPRRSIPRCWPRRTAAGTPTWARRPWSMAPPPSPTASRCAAPLC